MAVLTCPYLQLLATLLLPYIIEQFSASVWQDLVVELCIINKSLSLLC